jgi:hypothetical protein
MKVLVAHFLVAFVLVTFALPAIIHARIHGSKALTAPFLALAFFLPLNMLICLWEIGLGLHIEFITKEYARLKEKYGKQPFDAVIQFFLAELDAASLFSLKFWTKTWSTYVPLAILGAITGLIYAFVLCLRSYSLYDPSYSNRESFGFFVDVGNGWTTLVPSFLYLIGM